MHELTLEVAHSFMEGISRQSSIQTMAELLLAVFSQVYSEVRDHRGVKDVPFGQKKPE